MRKDLLERLFGLRRFGIRPGLERIEKILKDVGNPQNKIKSIHIAGTNGKGSISSFLASIYREAGYKVGLYTSPHIYSFNERIRINGVPISDTDLEPLVIKYLKYADSLKATFFEITTAVAFEYFAETNTDICIIETGMGGRFDATNILNPLATIISKIDYDHTDYLGTSIYDIVFEKAGIIKPNKVCFVSFNHQSVYDYLKKLKGSITNIIFVEKQTQVENLQLDPDVMKFKFRANDNEYEIYSPLVGKHQVENIITCIFCVEYLKREYSVGIRNIYNGVKNVRKNTGLFARFEHLRKSPPFIIDVAHNPNSVLQVSQLLECVYPTIQWNVIFASMKDKNYIEMLKILCHKAKTIILPNLRYERAERNFIIQKKFVEEIQQYCNQKLNVISVENTEEAFSIVKERNQPTLVIGSFYLISELVEIFRKEFNWDFHIYSDKIIV
ncbi:MAG: bifunctional folylpolyglutamate synthase/dihydrofolate synthase [Candidatus Kapaibacteriota bacterium]